MLSKAASAARSAGFTLTEMLITVAILAILVTMGLPSFRQLLQNYQVRVAAESVANGLQRRARGSRRAATPRSNSSSARARPGPSTT